MINKEDDEADWKIGMHILALICLIALILLINIWLIN